MKNGKSKMENEKSKMENEKCLDSIRLYCTVFIYIVASWVPRSVAPSLSLFNSLSENKIYKLKFVCNVFFSTPKTTHIVAG
jgi:hypothetical protein